ncbi:MAG: Cysteine synthase 2 [Ramalina farinacea]|uniref:Cysteine synthase 2 n=1 Tax=Ramalina farinacea TaxID=258253 RepID=A0AA43TXR0_9LECA|nr:Cysteine synthase 2 [Ramalina farinacea]
MDNRPKLYATVAFVAGVLVCLGFKDLYPDLERRYRRRYGVRKTLTSSSLALDDQIHLEDHEAIDYEDAKASDVPVGIEACIGNTPFSKSSHCPKLQFLNGGGGSPKDRVALSMINTAEEEGLLTPHSGDTIYEGTVGSTGISLATLGAVVERVPPAPIVDPMHFVNRARTLAAEHTADPNRAGRGYFADQFENAANWHAHFTGTGPEIYRQCHGKLDAFVAGAGTGGTIAGVARFLKSHLPHLDVVLADPQGSGLYNRIKYGVMFNPVEREGTRRRQQVDTIVEGIGINRVTANLEAGRELIDDAVKVTDDQALKMARWLVEKDGIFVGSSAAVNCVAAVETAQRLGKGKRVVTILCDSGSKHLSKFWARAGNIGGKVDSTLAHVMSESTPVDKATQIETD